jgi:hypothetical protein
MNRVAGLASAVGAIAVLVAGQDARAAAPPTLPPDSPIGVEIPADFVFLTDDTGAITIGVPNSWTDVDTAPNGVIPSIEASTDLQRYHDTLDVAGVTFRAGPRREDTEDAAREFGATSGCANEMIVPYDDGVFVGSHLIRTACGAPESTAEFHVVVANMPNRAFTAMLWIQIARPDEEPILRGILATFDVLFAAAPSDDAPSTTSGAPTTTSTAQPSPAFPPPTGEIPADWTHLVDDTQTIAISVPSSWSAVDLAPVNNEDGTAQPWISATTDQALFFPPAGVADTYSVPGVVYQAGPVIANTAEALGFSPYHSLCTADAVQTFDNSVFVGHIQSFSRCEGTGSRVVQVVANPADRAFTAVLLVQLTGQPDDAATLNGLLLSFDQVSPGG